MLTCVQANEDFFSEIHTGSLPQFGWLSQGFGSFEREPLTFSENVLKQDQNVEIRDDKEIVKRHYQSSIPKSPESQNKVYQYDPSNYYYPKKVSQYKTQDKLTVKLKEEEYGELHC